MGLLMGNFAFSLVCLCFLSTGFSNLYAIERTQSIQLKKGWNAVYLTVDPVVINQDVSAYMSKGLAPNTTTPIEIITTYVSSYSPIEYIKSQDEVPWKQPSWSTWIRDDLPEAFLSNLYDLHEGRAYLVKSSTAYNWQVTGEVRMVKRDWLPDSFNLTGFLAGGNSVSFYQLLNGSSESACVKNGPFYTLEGDYWKQVSVVDVPVEQNKAYWVFATKGCSYRGTMKVETDNGTDSLSFLDTTEYKSITIKNSSSNSMTINISLETNQVPLSLVTKNQFAERTYTPVTNTVSSFNLDPGKQKEITLSIRRSEITDTEIREGILKVESTETNEVQYIPVSGYGAQ
jgi:hypothetical protein